MLSGFEMRLGISWVRKVNFAIVATVCVHFVGSFLGAFQCVAGQLVHTFLVGLGPFLAFDCPILAKTDRWFPISSWALLNERNSLPSFHET